MSTKKSTAIVQRTKNCTSRGQTPDVISLTSVCGPYETHFLMRKSTRSQSETLASGVLLSFAASSRSKTPPCRKHRDKGGAPSSFSFTKLSGEVNGQDHARPDYRYVAVVALQGGDRGLVEVGDRVEGFAGFYFVVDDRGFRLRRPQALDFGGLCRRRLGAGGLGLLCF